MTITQKLFGKQYSFEIMGVKKQVRSSILSTKYLKRKTSFSIGYIRLKTSFINQSSSYTLSITMPVFVPLYKTLAEHFISPFNYFRVSMSNAREKS